MSMKYFCACWIIFINKKVIFLSGLYLLVSYVTMFPVLPVALVTKKSFIVFRLYMESY
jgi:nitrate reductase NapE component